MGRALVNKGQNMGVCARAFVLAKYAAALALVLMVINPRAAQAVPAFAQQTGQPCAAPMSARSDRS